MLVVEDSSLAIVASEVERHSSRPESWSSIFVITASNPSNLFVSSSMEVVICDSNLVALRGARAQPSHVPALQPKWRDREWATAPERLTGAMRWPPPEVGGGSWAPSSEEAPAKRPHYWGTKRRLQERNWIGKKFGLPIERL